MKEMDERTEPNASSLSLCFAMEMHATIDSVCKLCPSFSDQTYTILRSVINNQSVIVVR